MISPLHCCNTAVQQPSDTNHGRPGETTHRVWLCRLRSNWPRHSHWHPQRIARSEFPPILFALMSNFKGIPNPSILRNSRVPSLLWCPSWPHEHYPNPAVISLGHLFHSPCHFGNRVTLWRPGCTQGLKSPPLKLLLWKAVKILFQL